LAELNRIVARHGRGLDAVEPAARRMEAVEPAVAARRMEPAEAPRRPPPAREEPATNGGARAEPARARADITGVATPPMPARRADAPALSPAQPAAAASGRTGWLSDLLTRASQEAEAAVAREATPPREAPPQQEGARAERSSIDSLDTLAVDIARMIDHDAAAERWDRYKRSQRNVATRKIYTLPGQQAFAHDRRTYRSLREVTRTT